MFEPKSSSSFMLQCQAVSQGFVVYFSLPAAHGAVQSSCSRCSQTPTAGAALPQRIPRHKGLGFFSLPKQQQSRSDISYYHQKSNISMLICNTVKGLLCFESYGSLPLFELCMVLGDPQHPRNLVIPYLS